MFFEIQEYSISRFDAFCICLECSGERSGSSSYSSAYLALSDWLVELSLDLIKPKLLPANSTFSCLSAAGKFCRPTLHLPMEERFLFFKKQICKARIWDSDGGQLLKRLQKLVAISMEEIASLCDER